MTRRTYDRLKNFSTEIDADKTVAEIEKMLTKFGARRTLKEYDPNGNLIGLAFTVDTMNGEMPIKLPAKIDKIEQVFKVQASKKLLPSRYFGGEWARQQATRTAWRTLKDWVDAQFALISIEMVKVEEVFLPYAYSSKMGMTLYEAIENKKVDLTRMLDAGNEPDEPKYIDVDSKEEVE